MCSWTLGIPTIWLVVSPSLYLWVDLFHVSILSKGRKPKRSSKTAEVSTQKAEAVEVPKLQSEYGVEAWKRWIQKRPTQPNMEKPRFGCKSGSKVNATTKAELIVILLDLIMH